MTNQLALYESARAALAKAVKVDEVKEIRDKAMAIKAAAKIAKDREMEANAFELRARAERRLGEMMEAGKADCASQGGDRKSKVSGKLYIHPCVLSASAKAAASSRPCASPLLLFESMPMRRIRSACCARAANGQAAAEPAMLMKSRRRIAFPQGPNCATRFCNYSRDLRPAKWGSGAILHGSNPERSMSALGQKRTFSPYSTPCRRLREGWAAWSAQVCP